MTVKTYTNNNITIEITTFDTGHTFYSIDSESHKKMEKMHEDRERARRLNKRENKATKRLEEMIESDQLMVRLSTDFGSWEDTERIKKMKKLYNIFSNGYNFH